MIDLKITHSQLILKHSQHFVLLISFLVHLFQWTLGHNPIFDIITKFLFSLPLNPHKELPNSAFFDCFVKFRNTVVTMGHLFELDSFELENNVIALVTLKRMLVGKRTAIPSC